MDVNLKSRLNSKSRLRLEIKDITAEGSFEGILSPYGNVDQGGDVVEPGAYTKTLKERGSKVPLLWQHKQDVPIGDVALEDRKDGLWCKGQLLMDLPEAQKAYLLIKAKIVKGLSIGFETMKDSVEKGIRHLKEIKLYEGSIVTFPMNEMALITTVKQQRVATQKGDFNEEFEEIQTLNGFYDMQSALSTALRTVIWSDLSRDEKIAAAETILQQFIDAFSAFWPNYIDVLTEVYGESYFETYAASRILEIKAGAAISASNAEKIKSACDMIKSGHDSLTALLEGKAGATTLQTKAADESTEPAEDHSAVTGLLEQIQSELK
jgi:HK97 family phage prohead protease